MDTKKSQKSEMHERVAQIVQWKALGLTRREIIENSREKWGVGEKSVDSYIKKAAEEPSKKTEKKIHYYFNKAYERYEAIFKKAYSTAMKENEDKKDFFNYAAFSMAMQAQQRLDYITGIGKMNINIDTENNLLDQLCQSISKSRDLIIEQKSNEE